MAWIADKTEKQIKMLLEDLLTSLGVDEDIDGYDREVKYTRDSIVDILSDEKDDSYNEGFEDGKREAEE